MNENEKRVFKCALNRVWDQIGGDLLACTAENVMARDEVIEAVLDADRVGMFGGLTQEELAVWKGLSFQEHDVLAQEAFTYDFYGY